MEQPSTGRRSSDSQAFPTGWFSLEGIHPVLRVTIFILFWLGPCAIVAGVSMAMWAGWIPSPITQTRDLTIQINAKMEEAKRVMSAEVDRNRITDTQVVRLLWATCRNVSRSDLERVQCDNYWRDGNGK